MTPQPSLYGVIPAGGAGTRLWPLSRKNEPKFLHPLSENGRSLLQATFDRVSALASPARTYVVTGKAHRRKVTEQLPDLGLRNMIAEPEPKGSAAAIGLAAAVIATRDPEAVMGSFAADHVVGDDEIFASAISDAVALAQEDYLVTVGITPTYAATGFGWIQRGDALPGGVGERVREFTEKPGREVAERYLAGGGALWNASMFAWRVATLLGELERQMPSLYEGLTRIAQVWDTGDRERAMAEIWPGLPNESIDDGVVVGAASRGRVAVVPGEFEWHDIGDWSALSELLQHGEKGNAILGEGDWLSHDDQNTVVVSTRNRVVGTVGLRDMVVVDTPDAVLVLPRERAQEVRRLVQLLGERGDTDHL
ncbi:MAG: mannose-1-phosphate guanylyltransferase [Streptosporangiales bacterium]